MDPRQRRAQLMGSVGGESTFVVERARDSGEEFVQAFGERSEIELDNDLVVEVWVGIARCMRNQPFLENVDKVIECPAVQQ